MKLIKTSFMILALGGLVINCPKEKEDNSTRNLLLLFAADQASGNCATIFKTTVGSNTSYSASGTSVPKGGCNAATLDTALYTTSAATAASAAGTGFDALKAVYDADTTNCSANSAGMTSFKASVTEASVTTIQNALTSGATGCASASNIIAVRAVSGAISTVFICKDDASITAYKARTNYHPTSSVATDMAVSLTNLRTVATAAKSTSGFTDAAIAAMKAHGAEQLTVASKPSYLAYFFATGNCTKGIVSRDAALKAALVAAVGAASTNNSGITTAEASAVTAVTTLPFASSLSCGYGSGFTATTATGACPSTYPTF